MQRWTGGIAFVYIVWHTYTMRFSGTDLHDNPVASFGKVAAEVHNPWLLAVLRNRFDRGFVALRVWHLAVLRKMGDRGSATRRKSDCSAFAWHSSWC